MSKSESDEQVVRQACKRAIATNQLEIRLHYRTLMNVPALNHLITQEQIDAFEAMDERLSHPRSVTVDTYDVSAALFPANS